MNCLIVVMAVAGGGLWHDLIGGPIVEEPIILVSSTAAVEAADQHEHIPLLLDDSPPIQDDPSPMRDRKVDWNDKYWNDRYPIGEDGTRPSMPVIPAWETNFLENDDPDNPMWFPPGYEQEAITGIDINGNPVPGWTPGPHIFWGRPEGPGETYVEDRKDEHGNTWMRHVPERQQSGGEPSSQQVPGLGPRQSFEDPSGESCPEGGCPACPTAKLLQIRNQKGSLGRLQSPLRGLRVSIGSRARAPTHVSKATVHIGGACGVFLFGTPEKSMIATAYHVVEGQHFLGRVPVRLDGYGSYEGYLAKRKDGSPAVDIPGDIALVVIPLSSEPFSLLADTSPSMGNSLWVCGFEKITGKFRAQQGRLSSFGSFPGDFGYVKRYIQGMAVSGAEGRNGDSGGPIINAAGEVVGLVSLSSRGERGPNEFTFCSTTERIHALCADTSFPFPTTRRRKKN